MKPWTWFQRRRRLKAKARQYFCQDSALVYASRCVLQTSLCPFLISLKVGKEFVVIEDHKPLTGSAMRGELTAKKGDRVEFLEQSPTIPDWCLVRILDEKPEHHRVAREGLLPVCKMKPMASVVIVASGTKDNNNRRDKEQINDQIEITENVDRRKKMSFKRWFGSGMGRKNAAQRRLSADGLQAKSDLAKSDLRKTSSVYGKVKKLNPLYKLSKSDANCNHTPKEDTNNHIVDCGCNQTPIIDINPLTPPFASEEDLEESEQFSASCKETPSSCANLLQSSQFIIAQSTTMQNNISGGDSDFGNRTTIDDEQNAKDLLHSSSPSTSLDGHENENIIKDNIDDKTTTPNVLQVEGIVLAQLLENDRIEHNSGTTTTSMTMNDEKENGSSIIEQLSSSSSSEPQSKENERKIEINFSSSSVDQTAETTLIINVDDTVSNHGSSDKLSTPTTCDTGIIAIEDVDAEVVADDDQLQSNAEIVELPPEEQAKAKRKYVLMEFLETERDYVKDLGSLVEGYMATIESMELPEDMKGKDRFVFANIQQIYEFHKNSFLKEIENCVEDYDQIGRAFVKYERRLHMYVVYCQNKPKSEFLVSEYEQFFTDIKQKLGHRLNIGDLLIKPVQRIMKYQLLLKDILKYTQRSGESCEMLNKALHVMHVVPKACDDMMHVGRLQGFDGKITAQGKLLHQGTLVVSDNPSNQVFKGKDRRLFLFEQSLIIADCILPKKEFSNPQYIYKSHMMINKMGMETDVPGEPLRIILKNKDPTGPQDIIMQTSSPEDKQQWIFQIKQLLDTQMDFLKALQHPIAYQKGLNKDEPEEPVAAKPKTGKSPIMNRLAQIKSTVTNKDSSKLQQRTESCPGPTPPSSPNGQRPEGVVDAANAESRKHSLPDPKNSNSSSNATKNDKNAKGAAASSPKTKTRLFDSFRNPLKSKSTKLK